MFYRNSILLILVFFSANLVAQVPVINSFSPTSGLVGTVVTISGSNFNSVAANNIVYFGGVKASVLTASTNSLTVKVPVSASYLPISVTNNGLIAFSKLPFSVIFSNTDTASITQTFSSLLSYQTGADPEACVISDINGDGKPDIIVGNAVSNSISIFKNVSYAGIVAFLPKINFSTGVDTLNALGPFRVSVGDFDGDGKFDIVSVNRNANKISIFLNTTINDSISFATRIDFTAGVAPRDIAIADFNSDGKIDFAVSQNQGKLLLYKNKSTIGAISFDALDVTLTGNAFGLAAGDIDSDGKPDLALATVAGRISLLRNVSSGGSISFAAPVEYPTSTLFSSPRGIALGDLDGDEKLDVAVTDQLDNTYSSPMLLLLKNKSTSGTILYDTIIRYISQYGPPNFSLGNLDGDGKVDIVIPYPTAGFILTFKNNSANGNILFRHTEDYPANGYAPVYTTIADLDGDGKSDMVVVYRGSNSISVFKNKLGDAPRLCPNGNISLNANFTGSAFQWQLSTDSISYNNVTNGTTYNGVNSASLQLNNIPSLFAGYRYRCLVDGVVSNIYTLHFTNTSINSSIASWENPANWSCNTVPDANTDVIINNGTVILNSNVTVRSLTVNNGAIFNVTPGHTITINH